MDEALFEMIDYRAVFKDHKLRQMHGMYGELAGRSCAECRHLRRVRPNRTYFKCALFGESHGPGTDWRARWMACGRFEEAE